MSEIIHCDVVLGERGAENSKDLCERMGWQRMHEGTFFPLRSKMFRRAFYLLGHILAMCAFEHVEDVELVVMRKGQKLGTVFLSEDVLKYNVYELELKKGE
jgi:hypothetical protein